MSTNADPPCALPASGSDWIHHGRTVMRTIHYYLSVYGMYIWWIVPKKELNETANGKQRPTNRTDSARPGKGKDIKNSLPSGKPGTSATYAGQNKPMIIPIGASSDLLGFLCSVLLSIGTIYVQLSSSKEKDVGRRPSI